MIVRGYTLDLYCDLVGDDCFHDTLRFPHTFFGATWAETSQAAKKCGWKLDKKKGTAVCPKCAKAGKKLPKETV